MNQSKAGKIQLVNIKRQAPYEEFTPHAAACFLLFHGDSDFGFECNLEAIWVDCDLLYELASITVGYLDLETMNIVNTQMYIDGYQVKLVSDTSYGSLWEVSFTLKEF